MITIIFTLFVLGLSVIQAAEKEPSCLYTIAFQRELNEWQKQGYITPADVKFRSFTKNKEELRTYIRTMNPKIAKPLILLCISIPQVEKKAIFEYVDPALEKYTLISGIIPYNAITKID